MPSASAFARPRGPPVGFSAPGWSISSGASPSPRAGSGVGASASRACASTFMPGSSSCTRRKRKARHGAPASSAASVRGAGSPPAARIRGSKRARLGAARAGTDRRTTATRARPRRRPIRAPDRDLDDVGGRGVTGRAAVPSRLRRRERVPQVAASGARPRAIRSESRSASSSGRRKRASAKSASEGLPSSRPATARTSERAAERRRGARRLGAVEPLRRARRARRDGLGPRRRVARQRERRAQREFLEPEVAAAQREARSARRERVAPRGEPRRRDRRGSPAPRPTSAATSDASDAATSGASNVRRSTTSGIVSLSLAVHAHLDAPAIEPARLEVGEAQRDRAHRARRPVDGRRGVAPLRGGLGRRMDGRAGGADAAAHLETRQRPRRPRPAATSGVSYSTA